MDYSKKFRNMADRHMEETGEMLFSGKDANGYYFTFGFFPNINADIAMMEMQKRRDAVPHVIATGMDDGKEFTYRKCPVGSCISGPHPGKTHVDSTGHNFRS